jgi:hypothetical protein
VRDALMHTTMRETDLINLLERVPEQIQLRSKTKLRSPCRLTRASKPASPSTVTKSAADLRQAEMLMYPCQRQQGRSVSGLDSQMITLTVGGGTQFHSETAHESAEGRKRICSFLRGNVRKCP